ncbi:hypothetical protein GRS96_06270 [Rathayibacter sp. VKM Ac-2803]|uniref:hypothetical protein n=1 Tax=Rathayibacter sp. VKM Ac-2803 TaxID=2609256 RepID=UPI001359BA16|nr:hypothetical protein [Rathayibacter sp. VKM Ac-2803]MWV48882.1 hypothetical protein [Rathayibacter sp. VKM Ac-2803]
MAAMRSVTLPSTSRADDAALLALADASLAIAELDDACIVGGQMVALLCAAFPSADMITRRTVDADAAVSPVVAAAGTLHDLLITSGYTPGSGNHYVSGDREIDVLVPSLTGRFESSEHGGRGFDSAPGLDLALHGTLELDVTVILLDETPLAFSTRVPGVERALIVKALAYESRRALKDLLDIFNLMLIRNAHSPEEVGGWRIGDEAGTGARGDAASVLRRIAGAPGLRLMLRETGVPPGPFGSLLRTYISAD